MRQIVFNLEIEIFSIEMFCIIRTTCMIPVAFLKFLNILNGSIHRNRFVMHNSVARRNTVRQTRRFFTSFLLQLTIMCNKVTITKRLSKLQ